MKHTRYKPSMHGKPLLHKEVKGLLLMLLFVAIVVTIGFVGLKLYKVEIVGLPYKGASVTLADLPYPFVEDNKLNTIIVADTENIAIEHNLQNLIMMPLMSIATADRFDNCFDVYNPSQSDVDVDGNGDACDCDDEGYCTARDYCISKNTPDADCPTSIPEWIETPDNELLVQEAGSPSALPSVTGFSVADYYDTDNDKVPMPEVLIADEVSDWNDQNVIYIKKEQTPPEIHLLQNGENLELRISGSTDEELSLALCVLNRALLKQITFEDYSSVTVRGTCDNPVLEYPTAPESYPDILIEQNINGYTYISSESQAWDGNIWYQALYKDSAGNVYGAGIERYMSNEMMRTTFCGYLEATGNLSYNSELNVYGDGYGYMWYSGSDIIAIGLEEQAGTEEQPAPLEIPVAIMKEYLAKYPSDAYAWECDINGYFYSDTQHITETKGEISIQSYKIGYLKNNSLYNAKVFVASKQEDARRLLAVVIGEDAPTAELNKATMMYEYIGTGTNKGKQAVLWTQVFLWTHANYVIEVFNFFNPVTEVFGENIPVEKPQEIIDKYLWMYPTDLTEVCTDSDNGENYYEKGNVAGLEAPGIWNIWIDYCGTTGEEAGKLVEYICVEGEYGQKVLYECQYGCEDGKCITPKYGVDVSAETYKATDTVTPITYDIEIENKGTVLDNFGFTIETPEVVSVTEPPIIENLAPNEKAERTLTASCPNPGTYTINVTAYSQTDTEVKDSIELTLEVTGLYAKTFNFKQGFNLIALPVVPSNTNIRTLFADVLDKIEVIYGYDESSAQKWLVFYPDASIPQNLATFEPGKAYWIKFKEDATITITGTLGVGEPPIIPSISLTAGWNLVGVHSVVPVTMKRYFENIEGKYSSVWHYNQQIKDVEKLTITPETMLYPGEGYWIYMREAGVIIP